LLVTSPILNQKPSCGQGEPNESRPNVPPPPPPLPDRMLQPELTALIRANPQDFTRIVPGWHGAASESLRCETLRQLAASIRALQCLQAVLCEYPNYDGAYDIFGADLGHALNQSMSLAQQFRNCRECAGIA
jgi:hypothetical protein